MKSYKKLLESLSHDYVLHSLADKDINAHVKDGKVVVHPDDAASTRAHLRKIGHGHLKVTTKGAHQVAEEVELNEMTQGKSYSQKQLTDKINSGNWEAQTDIKPGKHVEMRHRSGKTVQVHVKEDFEQLDELSKKTLGSYVKKASHDVATNSAAVGRHSEREHVAKDKFHSGDGDAYKTYKKEGNTASKAFDRSWNRRKGIAKAVDKLAKESVELDESGFTADWRDQKHFGKGVPTNRPMTDKEKAEHEKSRKLQQDLNDMHKAAFRKEEVELDEQINQEGVVGAIAGGILGAVTGGPAGAVAGAYLGHKVQQGANAAKKTEKQNKQKLATEEVKELDEVLKGADAGEYVKDFQDSDAPQFKGKSKEKRQQMAIAAYLEAKRKNK